jgi:Cu-Zn family superoxide dismutase
VLNALGEPVKQWDTRALFNSGFVNDCIIDGTYAYFTDSYVQKIYRVEVNAIQPSEPEEWLSFSNSAIYYEAGQFNLNGIEATKDNKYLIVVNSYTGKLYRIDKATKNIAEITLNTPVTYGDGLYLDGNTLYVSRNALGQIFPVTLNSEYSAGVVGEPFGTGLLYNTTLAKASDYFLIVNGQLNASKPVLPFSVSRVKIPD